MAAERSYSFETGEKNSFQALDYVLFVFMLVVSAGIGVYYAIKDRKSQNTKTFLLASGNMHVLPVAMSLLASFISAITLLGTPSEMYNFGTMYIWIGLSYVLTIGLAAHVYIPIFYNLHVLSAYEYLELRFSRGVRTVGTCMFIVYMIIYMSIVLYGPALALNAVTGLSLWGAVVSVGLVCTVYTSIGGLKAVLWTDTFQVFMIMAGLLASLIQGCIEIGGFHKAWQIAYNNERVVLNDINPDPLLRHTVWSLVFGGGFYWLTIYGTNQAQVQRLMACPTLRHAQIAIWSNLPGLTIIMLICSMVGIVLFAFYSTCDPKTFGLIMASDQLYPLFVMDVLGHIPGVPGLFVSCVFSGSLSTISSGLNSLSAVVLQDIIKQYFLPNLNEEKSTFISKVIGVVFGIICICMAYVASHLGGILQAALSVGGVLGGPMLGLFTLGMLFPWANVCGAYVGVISGVALGMWISVGAQLYKPYTYTPPVQVFGCNWNVSTVAEFQFDQNSTVLTNTGELGIYSLSYLYYAPVCVITVITVGLLVSFISGRRDPRTVDARLICPIFDVMMPYLPEKLRRKLRFGINHKGKYNTHPTQSEAPLRETSKASVSGSSKCKCAETEDSNNVISQDTNSRQREDVQFEL